MTIEDGRRVARNGDMLIRGVGVTSDKNGPHHLMFRIDGTGGNVLLWTRQWEVEWETEETGNHVDVRHEYGYRFDDGREVWESDHGGDGRWTPHDPESGVKSVDIYSDEQAVRAIAAAIQDATANPVVIRRRVETKVGDTEVVKPSTSMA